MKKVGIVGGTGYTGVELLRILANHPEVVLHTITSRKEAGLKVAQMYPNLRGRVDNTFSSPDEAKLEECDVVFFATPHGVAMEQAKALLGAGVKIIDLAADFRLQDTQAFEQWYKIPHACPDVLKTSVYGLVELNREKIQQTNVIGNPGCYPTTVILGLAPLLEKNLIDTDYIVADCKSGVSGAGRKAELGSLFAEVSDSMKAYGLSGHRHHPEIVEQLSAIAKKDVGLVFVPHLTPMIRGMLSTLYVKIRPEALDTDFQQVYEERYANEQFIDVLPFGTQVETRTVRASNQLRIALSRPYAKDSLVITVVQDNLVKGAAGQAVQNMNVLFGFPEETGLTFTPILP